MSNVTISAAGVQGPRGNGWLISIGPPADTLGVDGDLCLDQATPDAPSYYGPKANGTWTGAGPYTFGGSSAGALLAANNLDDVDSTTAARASLGLGTAATEAATAFDTAGAAATAQSNAETYTSTQITAEVSRANGAYDAAGAAASAQTAAESYTSSQISSEVTRANAAYLTKSNDLSDVDNPSTARSNLGLGTAATAASSAFDAAGAASTAQSNAETFTSTQLAAEVTRANAAYDAAGAASAALTTAEGYTGTQITSEVSRANAAYLGKTNNLSDVNNPATARSNLGLGTAAVAGAATTSAEGIVQLAGDLGGTAASPSVLKVGGISISGTPALGEVPTATGAGAATWQAPPSVPNPGLQGLLSWNFDPILATSDWVPTTAANGVLYLTAMPVAAAFSTSQVGYGLSGAQATGLTVAQNGIALYDINGNLLTQTADLTATWSSSSNLKGLKAPWLTAETVQPPYVYVVWLCNGVSTGALLNFKGVAGEGVTADASQSEPTMRFSMISGLAATAFPSTLNLASQVTPAPFNGQWVSLS